MMYDDIFDVYGIFFLVISMHISADDCSGVILCVYFSSGLYIDGFSHCNVPSHFPAESI